MEYRTTEGDRKQLVKLFKVLKSNVRRSIVFCYSIYHPWCVQSIYILEQFNKVQSAVSRGVFFIEPQGKHYN